MNASERESADLQVAVLGAGIMGSAMARNLISAGLRTTVWDRSSSVMEGLSAAGAQAARSAEEAVRGARMVITMLPTDEALHSVVFQGRVVDAFSRGAVWAQMGTIGVAETARLASRVGQLRRDLMFVDAPVSGSKGPAISGQLLILQASRTARAERVVEPAFSAIGRKTVWLGQAGLGSRMKVVVNAYMAMLIEGVAEALELADRLGVDVSKLIEVIEGGPLDAPIADAKLHKMEPRRLLTPSSRWRWALKDVDLALAAAGDGAAPLLAALSRQWHAAVDAGLGRRDVSAARLALGGHQGGAVIHPCTRSGSSPVRSFSCSSAGKPSRPSSFRGGFRDGSGSPVVFTGPLGFPCAPSAPA